MSSLSLLVAAVLWGGAFTASKAGAPALPSLWVAFLRSFGTAAVMAPGPAGPSETGPQGRRGR